MARFPTTAVGGQCDANSSRLLRRVRYYTPLPFAREGARRLRAQRSSEASLGCGGALMEVASQAAPTAAPTASSSFSSPAEGPIALQPRSPRSPLPLAPPVQELPVAVPRPAKTTVEIKTLVPRLLSTPSTTARREPTSQSYRCKAMMEVVDFQMLCEHTLERLPSPHIKDAKVYEVDSGALMHADGCGFGLTVAWRRSEDGGHLDLASKLGASVFRTRKSTRSTPGRSCTRTAAASASPWPGAGARTVATWTWPPSSAPASSGETHNAHPDARPLWRRSRAPVVRQLQGSLRQGCQVQARVGGGLQGGGRCADVDGRDPRQGRRGRKPAHLFRRILAHRDGLISLEFCSAHVASAEVPVARCGLTKPRAKLGFVMLNDVDGSW
mmetsp:Transcript_104166/g.335802  ORF Transcript_104166/g.335802 Transcript_104166/m.335802 type:complete len:384 (-) Transcript_104166:190-1341(-)